MKEYEDFDLDDDDEDLDDSAGGGENDWAVSYADMMTLIACFFIIMMAFANYDKATFDKAAKEVALHFKGANIQVEENLMTELMVDIEAQSTLERITKISQNHRGLEIKFQNESLFESGKATLQKELQVAIDILVGIVINKSKNFTVIVEGHTDNEPIGNRLKHIYPSNWELSSARSTSIVRRFEKNGYPEDKLFAIGFGKSRPLVKNINEENQKSNRRIILRVLKPNEKFKLGFGVVYGQE